MISQAGEILLKNNQAEYADVLTFYMKTFKGLKIEYTTIRGDKAEVGDIHITFNRLTKEAQVTTEADFDDVGVRFCAKVDKDYVRLLYTSTNTGIAPTFKYAVAYFDL